MKKNLLLIGVIFIILVSAVVYSQLSKETAPSNHLEESQILVTSNQVIINSEDIFWAKFTDTNSMYPVIDTRANTIEKRPKNIEEINIGDIISFNTEYGIVIHRVVDISEDKEGIYFTTKGDNNLFKDPWKTRFQDVNGIVIGILY